MEVAKYLRNDKQALNIVDDSEFIEGLPCIAAFIFN